jgi:hypothetical protein
MPNDVTRTVIESGLIEQDTLKELRHWGAPIPTCTPTELPDPMLVPSLIEHAMQQEEYVTIKETDLEILQQYLKTQQPGLLYIDGSGVDQQDSYIEVTFGRTLLGEYILPWQTGKDLVDLITLPSNFLLCQNPKVESGQATRVYFKDARDLYYGDQVAFVVCASR